MISRSQFYLFSVKWGAMICLCLYTSLAIAKVDDVDLKAVYLFRFALLADWQKTSVHAEHLEYCVLEAGKVSARLKNVVELKPDIAHFYNLSEEQHPNVCHILYVEDHNESKISLLKTQFPHALLVGNGKAFIDKGGMIAFIKVRNRIRPLISRKHVKQTQVQLRSQLLEVSELVKEDER